MDVKVFEVLGKYAGLAGISIGLVLLVFRAVLKRNIYPKLNTQQAYALLRLLIILTFATGLIGIGSWTFVAVETSSGQTIRGDVRDADSNAPIQDAEIVLVGRTESARTDVVGNFSLLLKDRPRPEPSMGMYILKQGYQPYTRNVEMGDVLVVKLAPKQSEGKESSVEAVRKVFHGCYTRAVFTRTHAELGVEPMFRSLSACRLVVQDKIPDVSIPELARPLANMLACLDELERLDEKDKGHVDPTEVDKYKLELLRNLELLSRATKLPYPYLMGYLGESFLRMPRRTRHPCVRM